MPFYLPVHFPYQGNPLPTPIDLPAGAQLELRYTDGLTLPFGWQSDVYDEEFNQALEESDGDEEYAAFPENHTFIIPEGAHWKDIRIKTKNVVVFDEHLPEDITYVEATE